MKKLIPLLLFLGVTLSACNDESAPDAAAAKPAYEGLVTVALTSGEQADGRFKLRNIFPHEGTRVIAIVQIDKAQPGTIVTGEWTRLATLQPNVPDQTPEGIVIGKADVTIEEKSINTETAKGSVRLQLISSKPLPPDSYLLRVYVDGQLARTSGFVLVPLKKG